MGRLATDLFSVHYEGDPPQEHLEVRREVGHLATADQSDLSRALVKQIGTQLLLYQAPVLDPYDTVSHFAAGFVGFSQCGASRSLFADVVDIAVLRGEQKLLRPNHRRHAKRDHDSILAQSGLFRVHF